MTKPNSPEQAERRKRRKARRNAQKRLAREQAKLARSGKVNDKPRKAQVVDPRVVTQPQNMTFTAMRTAHGKGTTTVASPQKLARLCACPEATTSKLHWSTGMIITHE